MKILFITARLPYPPHKGDQVLPYHRLRLLSRHHQITLVSFYEQEADLVALPVLEQYCEKIIVVQLTKRQGIINMLKYGLFSRCPFQVLYYSSKQFKQVINALPLQAFDIIHTFMLRVAPHAPTDKNVPCVLELIDSMELNFRRRLNAEKWFWKPLVKEEISRLRRYEYRMVEKFDAAIVVAEIDKEVISHPKIECIPLGVDGAVFYPSLERFNNPRLVFSGNMGYYVNEKAIIWFIARCWASIKKQVPAAILTIVGTKPSEALRQYAKKDSTIHILGFVDSPAAELRKATLAIAPMQSGSGMQNKVLEAMACGLPVVSTSLGIGNIQAIPQKEVLIADSPDEFVQACVSLLKNPLLSAQIGTQAAQLMKNKYRWEANAAAIEAVYSRLSRS